MKPLVLTPRVTLAALAAATFSLAALPASAASSSGTAAAAAPSASAPAQRTKMKTCNADAKGKHGDERKAFMKQCLSKKGAASEAS
jgi:Spy/CpxP family protein refolding chaperone